MKLEIWFYRKGAAAPQTRTPFGVGVGAIGDALMCGMFCGETRRKSEGARIQ
jgi:hypothetical protein